MNNDRLRRDVSLKESCTGPVCFGYVLWPEEDRCWGPMTSIITLITSWQIDVYAVVNKKLTLPFTDAQRLSQSYASLCGIVFFFLSATMQVYSHWKKRRGIVWSMADSFSWFLLDIIWEWRGVRAAAGMSASTWIFISLEKKIGHLSKAEPWPKEIRWWELSCISNGNMNKNTTVTCNGITSNIAWVQWVQVGKHG